jgi:lipopolysaccharide/colanic/teichoic acid biosynthesis glycosyltransferase
MKFSKNNNEDSFHRNVKNQKIRYYGVYDTGFPDKNDGVIKEQNNIFKRIFLGIFSNIVIIITVILLIAFITLFI